MMTSVVSIRNMYGRPQQSKEIVLSANLTSNYSSNMPIKNPGLSSADIASPLGELVPWPAAPTSLYLLTQRHFARR
jgi:hypothetical protein